MTAGLVLNAPPARGTGPGPSAATVIFPDLRRRVLQFADLPALARFIHRERAGRGLQLRTATASYDASDSFPAILLSWETDGDTEWAFTLAIQHRSQAALEAAIAAANPDLPEAWRLTA